MNFPHNVIISAIIVCTNEKIFLRPALSTLILALKNIPSEIIVVDNNSSDGSRELIRKDFPNVILIENPKNQGAAYARNRGIKKASGQYLVFLDCDTEVLDGAMEKLLSYIDTHPEIGILSPQLLYPDRTIQHSSRSFPTLRSFFSRVIEGDFKFLWRRKNFKTEWDHASAREVDWTMSACWLVPRIVIDKVGTFDDGYFYNYEDIDFCWRTRKAGLSIFFYPEAKVIHHYQRLSAKGGVRNPLKWSHLKSALRFFAKKAFS